MNVCCEIMLKKNILRRIVFDTEEFSSKLIKNDIDKNCTVNLQDMMETPPLLVCGDTVDQINFIHYKLV